MGYELACCSLLGCDGKSGAAADRAPEAAAEEAAGSMPCHSAASALLIDAEMMDVFSRVANVMLEANTSAENCRATLGLTHSN